MRRSAVALRLDWKKTTVITENKTVLLGESRKPYISASKVIEL